MLVNEHVVQKLSVCVCLIGVCACEKRITAHRDRWSRSCRRHGTECLYFLFFFYDKRLGRLSRGILPPNTNPCYAEERDDLLLMKLSL